MGTLVVVAGGMTVMDAARVSHKSPDTDVSNEDAEIFEVHLNSAKLLSPGRTCVGVHVCTCVFM